MKENRYQWKLRRKGKDITLEEVSRVIGSSISMISRHENNKRDLSNEKLEAYKKYIAKKEVY